MLYLKISNIIWGFRSQDISSKVSKDLHSLKMLNRQARKLDKLRIHRDIKLQGGSDFCMINNAASWKNLMIEYILACVQAKFMFTG